MKTSYFLARAALLAVAAGGAGLAGAAGSRMDVPPSSTSPAVRQPSPVVEGKVSLQFVATDKSGQPIYYIPELGIHVVRIPKLNEIAAPKR